MSASPTPMTAPMAAPAQNIMVHGDCTSAGCYAMTDAVVEEIFILAREALQGGQPAFQIQAFPFRMTAANMARAQGRQVVRLLEEPEGRLRLFRDQPAAAEDRRVREALSDQRRLHGDARPDPDRRLPGLSELADPARAAMQEASTKPASKTPSASLAKPLGSVLGLNFGPSKPYLHAPSRSVLRRPTDGGRRAAQKSEFRREAYTVSTLVLAQCMASACGEHFALSSAHPARCSAARLLSAHA